MEAVRPRGPPLPGIHQRPCRLPPVTTYPTPLPPAPPRHTTAALRALSSESHASNVAVSTLPKFIVLIITVVRRHRCLLDACIVDGTCTGSVRGKPSAAVLTASS